MFVSDQTYEVEFQKNNRINITIVVKLLTPLDGLLCSRHYAKSYTWSLILSFHQSFAAGIIAIASLHFRKMRQSLSNMTEDAHLTSSKAWDKARKSTLEPFS